MAKERTLPVKESTITDIIQNEIENISLTGKTSNLKISIKEIERFYPKTKQQWREWLIQNHIQKNAIWVIFHKQKSGKPTLSWSEAVDEALCFGWIDSIKKSMGDDSSIQYFSKRKPKSTWSKVNKDKVQKFIEANLMTQAGFECIEIAKQNGSWVLLDEVEELKIPKDLETALMAKENAMNFFLNLSKSTRKAMLQWLVLAKRPETRQKRIVEIVELADKQLKPKQF